MHACGVEVGVACLRSWSRLFAELESLHAGRPVFLRNGGSPRGLHTCGIGIACLRIQSHLFADSESLVCGFGVACLRSRSGLFAESESRCSLDLPRDTIPSTTAASGLVFQCLFQTQPQVTVSSTLMSRSSLKHPARL